MKAVSTANIVLAAAFMITGGFFFQLELSRLLVRILGGMVGVAGLAGRSVSLM